MIAKYEKPAHWSAGHASARSYKNLHNLPHWHTEHEIVCVSRGTVDLTVNNGSYRLSAGMGAFIMSEIVHTMQADEESVVNVIKLDPIFVERIIGEKRLVCPILSRDYRLLTTYADISKELKEGREYGDVIADCLVARLTAEIFRGEETESARVSPGRNTQKYKELLSLLNKNYADITFEEAAAFMNMSRPYFSKFFHTMSGMTFTYYLNTIRVSAAVEKVAEGDMDMTEVSMACGFNTVRNFNRVFKVVTGYSPNRLPERYVFSHPFKDDADSGFDATLGCTVVLDA